MANAQPTAERIATVVDTPGLVAFWDFVEREPDGERRFTAHTSADDGNEYPLGVANYVPG